MNENKGDKFRGVIIGLALVAGAFLFIKIRKNRNPLNIYKQLKEQLLWPETEKDVKYSQWLTKPQKYIAKNFSADSKNYKVFIWNNGHFTIKEYDKAKTYPVFSSGKLLQIYPLVFNIEKPLSRKGVKFKAKDVEALLNKLTGTKIIFK